VIRLALTDLEAVAIAKAFAGTLLDVVLCESPPPGLYAFTAMTDYLFEIRNPGSHTVGASDYIAVSRVDGKVRFVGRAGE